MCPFSILVVVSEFRKKLDIFRFVKMFWVPFKKLPRCAQQLANIKLGIGATTNGENRENINIGQQTVRAVNVLKLDISLDLQKF